MLNEQQLKAIKELQKICEKNENIQLKLNWEMLQTRKKEDKWDFLYYENDNLVGFLAIYPFGTDYEICGMVHPSLWGQGIFTKLFREAINVIPGNARKILINAPAASVSAKHWLEKQAVTYDFSEYQMKWQPKRLEAKEPSIRLRKADNDDFGTKVKLDVECFGFDESGAHQFNQDTVNNDKKVLYMIDVDNETIGKIGVMRDEQEIYIYGFAIFPQFQGKGYGRSALTQTVLAEEQSGKDIVLEVAAGNKHALKLYEDCGFQSYEGQDYYHYNR